MTKTIEQFIDENRAELIDCITKAQTKHDKPAFNRHIRTDDHELRLWILNDEGLYNWARQDGVEI